MPWLGDIVRYLPNERRSFFERCQQALEQNARPYVVLRGDWQTRFESAVAAVTAATGVLPDAISRAQ